MKRTIRRWLGINLLRGCCLLVLVILGSLLTYITVKGGPVISWQFLTDYPRKGMTQGGIYPAIIGTLWVTLTSTFFALPLGVACAIYLSEYARHSGMTSLVRAAFRNLAGVPSIIYGLFGVTLFVDDMHLGTSILSAGLTLGLLTLPYIVTISEEALRVVPQAYREGAMALGATQWETISRVVLPVARPGIVTGGILALSRAAGETAPLLFTGVTFYLRYLPVSVFDPFMALPYHIYILSTQHYAIEQVQPLAFGTALVLLALVFLLNILAFFLRYTYRTRS